MELSQAFLIEMAINGLGYLLAGIISIFLYAMATKRKSTATLDLTSEEEVATQPEEIPTNHESTTDRKVEYITFGSQLQQQKSIEQPQIKIEEPVEKKSGRMNRKEAISLAKKMLTAGATHEKIKRILPVSESELALLSLNNK